MASIKLMHVVVVIMGILIPSGALQQTKKIHMQTKNALNETGHGGPAQGKSPKLSKLFVGRQTPDMPDVVQALPVCDARKLERLAPKFYISGRRTVLQSAAVIIFLLGMALVQLVSKSASASSRKAPSSNSAPKSAMEATPLVDRLVAERRGDFRSLLDLLSIGQKEDVAIGATDGRTSMTYAALCELVKGIDLSPHGVQPKSVVAFIMPAGDYAAGLMMALLGCYTTVPLNPNLTQGELLSAIELFEIKVVLTVDAIEQKLGAELSKDVRIIKVTPDMNLAGVFHLQSPHGTTSASKTNASAEKQVLNGPDDNVLLLGTSGTTSKPKVVPITLRRLALGAFVWANRFGIKNDDCALNMMPLFHVGGIITNVLALLLSGAGVFCAPKLEEEEFIKWIQEFRITYYSAVPTMHQQVTNLLNDAAPDDVASVRAQLRIVATGAAHLPHAAALQLKAATGATILSTYGMTECMPISIAPRDFSLEDKPDCCGRPVCAVTLFVDDGIPVSTLGEKGEVCVRGPLVIPEYLSGGKASWYTTENGNAKWFRTGDLGTLDADGFLKLVGRAKEVINRGGELISPFEVEGVALKFEGVRQCMAFSAPHEMLGETIGLAVMVHPGVETISFGGLQQFMLQTLASVKVPEVIVILEELPKGPTGKVSRIGFSDRLGMASLSSATLASERVIKAEHESVEGKDVWTLSFAKCDDSEGSLANATDSLGLPSRGNALTQQAVQVFTCLYAPASIAILADHTFNFMTASWPQRHPDAASWGALGDNVSPIFVALASHPHWAMYIFFAGLAFTDKVSNTEDNPWFQSRDILFFGLAAAVKWANEYTFIPFTKLYFKILTGTDENLVSLMTWFFCSIPPIRLYLIFASHVHVWPSFQVAICMVAAALALPSLAQGSEWYLFAAMYALVYHYGVEVASFVLKSLQEAERTYTYLFPRTIAAIVLVGWYTAMRIPFMEQACVKEGTNRIMAHDMMPFDGTIDLSFPGEFGDMSNGLLLTRLCVTPLFLALDVLSLTLAFIAFSGSLRVVQYLGAGALGTFIVGSFARKLVGWVGIMVYGVPVIPTMEQCALFATKYTSNNDSTLLSVSQWLSFGIYVFPVVAFAATFGRLYQEVFLYLFKNLGYLKQVTSKFVGSVAKSCDD